MRPAAFWKSVLAMILIAASALTLGGCNVTSAPPNQSASIRAYSYPLTNGQQYKYARFTSGNNSSPAYDTETYQVAVGFYGQDVNRLFNLKSTKTSDSILYNFIFGADNNGNAMAEFYNGSTSFIALDGTLADSSTWVADTNTETMATVVEHDDNFLPDPSRTSLEYQDVIVIAYHRDSDPIDNYVLRFYARNVGLILEKDIVGSTTVIGTLELIATGDPLS